MDGSLQGSARCGSQTSHVLTGTQIRFQLMGGWRAFAEQLQHFAYSELYVLGEAQRVLCKVSI